MGKLFRWMGIILAMVLLTGCTVRRESGKRAEVTTAPERVTPATNPEFPYTLQDGLVVEEIVTYSGEYRERGKVERVENITGLMLYNPSEQMLRFAAVSLETDGRSLYFFVYCLPPQSRCLVLEYEKRSCDAKKITACRELSLRWEKPEFSRELVDYVCLGRDMTVINRDARSLACVTVWYKRYVGEGDFYLGGNVYAEYFPSMQPGERRTLQPEHYDAANARIVGIEAEI